MCYGGFSFPNDLGTQIAELKPGDQIIVLMNEGDPSVERDRVDIVWKVSGFSALTAGGISIGCLTISKLVRTGQHFEDYLVSPEAKKIWAEIQSGSNPVYFDIEPE